MRIKLTVLLCTFLTINLMAQSPIHSSESIHHPIAGTQGMVATQHEIATEVGLEILRQGGNAVDAAVGVGFALAVVLPRAGNIGGGGFMLVHMADNNLTKAINYREMAPAAAHTTMFQDEDGEVDKKLFNQSYKSVGVPGSVMGLLTALEKYGSLPRKKVMAPAIRLAEKGFPVTYDLARVLRLYEKRMKKSKVTQKIFYKGNNFYKPGDLLIQKDLAWSLKEISKHGSKAFYDGKVGDKLSDFILKNGGIITREDLKNYKVTIEDPVEGTYRGFTIASMPPPSSGGIHIIQMLNILEHFPLGYLGHNSAETLHLMAEAMRYAYADRSEHLGDPAFWDVPVAGVTSKSYGGKLADKISRYQNTPSAEIGPTPRKDLESEETTHFTVVDREGNAVVNTYTLNFSLGTGLVAGGTGILLNNEMGDFSPKPGEPDAYGLVGGEANSVQAGKRPLSSMTPTMVFKDGELFLATGSPGGSRIITTVLQVILNVIDHKMNVAEASHAPRIHHQWYPDILFMEKGISHDTKSLLAGRGHRLKQRTAMGSTQSIMVLDGIIYGASDPRRPDAKTMGY